MYYNYTKINILGFYLNKLKDSITAYITYREFDSNKEYFLFDSSKNDITKDYNVTYIKPNWNGNKIAVGLTKDGKEIGIIVVLDVITKKVDNYICLRLREKRTF